MKIVFSTLRLLKSFSLFAAIFAAFLALIDLFCLQKPVRFEFVLLTLLLILHDLTEFVPSNLTSFCTFAPFPVLCGPLSSLLPALSAGALIGQHQ
jgi:hypothetical protein